MKTPNPLPAPPAACSRCGGWTSFGGCSQFHSSLVPVHGRTGCFCTKSERDIDEILSLLKIPQS